MKYFLLLSFCYCAFSSQIYCILYFECRTYFGEYFQCSIFDKCKEEYQTCSADSTCAYQMFSSPCIDPCGVDYAKFFQQLRTYKENRNDSENIALFPTPSCDFTTCQTTWIDQLNNTALKALKQCEMQKCLSTYPSYTYIAHEFAELVICNNLIAACMANPTCAKIVTKIDECIGQKGAISPQTNPNQYFYDHLDTTDNEIIQCMNEETSQDQTYLELADCAIKVWSI